MVIIDKRCDFQAHFEDIYAGDVFEFDDSLYLKIWPVLDSNTDCICNAVNVLDGEHYVFDGMESVVSVKAEIHVINN